ncbi:hypothetical protein [Pedobacter insulae]|uniref:DUF4251 domain-containing protein n=1 Tax=Pedobacter insulae TaxID=414048 RepID=A0A1I2Y6N9_9SPHI|nr:hypothetical protein [Pedobacter insulae]SFH20626.1 hypothetical protein SAMN04489864_106223 [Pedobacter insulae]
MKQIAAMFLFLLFLGVCKGQTKTVDYSTTIKEQAGIMGHLLLKKDFNSFCRYTYPSIIDMMGGKQKMVEIMEKGSIAMQSEGTTFVDVTFGDPSKIIAVGNELQFTVPQTIEMKVPNGRLTTQSTLIAISINKGKNWYFVDTSGKDISSMKKVLPNLSGDLKIPKMTQPIFYPDKKRKPNMGCHFNLLVNFMQNL